MIDEVESEALRSTTAGWERLTASALARVELARTLRRLGVEAVRGRQTLATLSLIPITDAVLDRASAFVSPILRSLDAIHLASAVLIGDELGAFVSYDERLLAAAEEAALPTFAPR